MACVGPGEERDTVSCPFGGNMMGGARGVPLLLPLWGAFNRFSLSIGRRAGSIDCGPGPGRKCGLFLEQPFPALCIAQPNPRAKSKYS